MWFSCAFLKTYGNPVPFPLGAHCTYILPCNALMSLRAKRGNLPEGYPYETKQIKNIILSIGHSCCIDDHFFNEKLSGIRVECVLDKKICF